MSDRHRRQDDNDPPLHRIEQRSEWTGAAERADVAVVRDPRRVRVIGVVPVEETLDAQTYERAIRRIARNYNAAIA